MGEAARLLGLGDAARPCGPGCGDGVRGEDWPLVLAAGCIPGMSGPRGRVGVLGMLELGGNAEFAGASAANMADAVARRSSKSRSPTKLKVGLQSVNALVDG